MSWVTDVTPWSPLAALYLIRSPCQNIQPLKTTEDKTKPTKQLPFSYIDVSVTLFTWIIVHVYHSQHLMPWEQGPGPIAVFPTALNQSNNIDTWYTWDDLYSRSGKFHSTKHLHMLHHHHFFSKSILGLSGSLGSKSLQSRKPNSASAILIHQNPFHKFRCYSRWRTKVKSWSYPNPQQNRVEHDLGFTQHPTSLTASPVSYVRLHFTTQNNHQSKDKMHNRFWNLSI